MSFNLKAEAEGVSRVIQEAGGKVVGRTRLQKICYLLEVMELGEGFRFSYKHYGPFSEQLTLATQMAESFNLIKEEEHQATWGGYYSVFCLTTPVEDGSSTARKSAVVFANSADAVELELAATAVLLASDGFDEPWQETANRKPTKVGEGRLDRAKVLLEQLRKYDINGGIPVL